MRFALAFLLVVLIATSVFGLEKTAYKMAEDFGTEVLYDGALQYYYYIPCPTYSWFWAFSGWSPGDIIGCCFNIPDQGTGGWDVCDPVICGNVQQIRILDFAGYGTIYPGLFTFELDGYCSPEGCYGPTRPFLHLWNSGPLESGFGWNYYESLYFCISLCLLWPSYDAEPYIVTATMTGTEGSYPAWGFDNISTPLGSGCVMHDIGCLPAIYPRSTCGGPEPAARSGYIGTYMFEHWPPLGFADGADTTPNASQFGYVELAWRTYFICVGPSGAEPTTWGKIKSMYK
jgi:hypothetical protein